APRGAGEAPARAPVAGGLPAGRDRPRAGGRADRLRDAPGLAPVREGRAVPGGSVRAGERAPGQAAAAARAQGGRLPAREALLPAVWLAAADVQLLVRRGAPAPRLALQRARAGELHQA